MASTFRTLFLTTSCAVLACTALIGCGARSVMEMGAYQDGGFVENTDEAGPDTAPDGQISDGPVYDHVNDINGCNPSTCGGCCDEYGNCRTGLDSNACGIGGYQCINCVLYNAGCNAGTHECGPVQDCSPSTCPSGCCDTYGVCMSGVDGWACGTGGYACSDCQMSGMYCDPYGKYCTGQPTCGPDNCGGCCSSWGTCEWGGDMYACGLGGGFCEDCSMYGMQCDSYTYTCQPSQTCSPASCPYGCCDIYSGQCLGGMDPWSCGTGGQVCQQCTNYNQECAPSAAGGGICQPIGSECGPWNCAGCCDCSDPNYCTCMTGLDPWACGYGGQVCQYCADATLYCEPTWGGGGQCLYQPPQDCGSWNCTGCCDYNTYPPQCLWGGDSWACGSQGSSCYSCAPGETCDLTPWGGGQCGGSSDCGSWNCSGCCDYSTYPPQCLWGGDTWACGSQGSTCSYCDYGQACELTPWGGGQCGGTSDCGPWNCAGCCDYNSYPPQCLWGGDTWACGSAGDACYPCDMNSTCQPMSSGGGYCSASYDGGTDCGPWNCGGCCNYSTWPPFCDTGTYPWSCGSQGQQCYSCPPGAECLANPWGGGSCAMPPPDAGPPPPIDAGSCGPWNCNGCCSMNGNCLPGQSNQRCGQGGVQCVNCSNQGLSCSNGYCQ